MNEYNEYIRLPVSYFKYKPLETAASRRAKKKKRIKAMNWIDCLAVGLYIGIAAIVIYRNRNKKKYYGRE